MLRQPVGPPHRGYAASDRLAPQVVTDFGSRGPEIVGCVPGTELGTIESHPTGSHVQEGRCELGHSLSAVDFIDH